jgi:Fe2+ transport system protein FeoA
MDLSEIPAGRRVRILSIAGGKEMCRRLAELAIFEGEEALIERNDGGPVILSIMGSKIAVGHGQAVRILVELIK